MEQTHHHKRLYRSRTDRVLAGVCGGLARYMNVDSSIVRLVWAAVVVFTGLVPGVLVYLVAMAAVPEEPVVL